VRDILTDMKNINRTDHFLLAQDDRAHSRGTSTLEIAVLILSVACVVGLAALLVQS
jgi:hypothetical protein